MRIALKAERVCVSYGGVPAVHGASFSLYAEETVCLLGRNGAGKSSLVAAVAGVVPFRGLVEVFGENLRGGRAADFRKRGVVLVPERRELFTSLSVEDNLLLGGYVKHRSQRHLRASAEMREAYEIFPVLAEARDRRAGELSGGQQQMLAIARGLMAQPRVLVLDEPSLGLAPVVADAIYAALGGMADRGLSLLIVEENPERVAGIAERVLLLNRGKLVYEGKASDIKDNEMVKDVYFGARYEEGGGENAPRYPGAS